MMEVFDLFSAFVIESAPVRTTPTVFFVRILNIWLCARGMRSNRFENMFQNAFLFKAKTDSF